MFTSFTSSCSAFAALKYTSSSIINIFTSYKSFITSYFNNKNDNNEKSTRSRTISTSTSPSLPPPSSQVPVEEEEGLVYSLSLDRSQTGRFCDFDPYTRGTGLRSRMPANWRWAIENAKPRPVLKSCLRNRKKSYPAKTLVWNDSELTSVRTFRNWVKLGFPPKQPERRSERIKQKKQQEVQVELDAVLNVLLSSSLPFGI